MGFLFEAGVELNVPQQMPRNPKPELLEADSHGQKVARGRSKPGSARGGFIYIPLTVSLVIQQL